MGETKLDGSRFRLDDLTVDLDSGEVRYPSGRVERLAPQPASLLALLMENAGEVVDRERIREHIWGDVAVDFEAGLHYCVRQVRAALGESASEARFVETLARRGYRLKVRPEPWEGEGSEADSNAEHVSRQESSLPVPVARAAVGALAVLLLTVFGLALSGAPSVVPSGTELTVQRLAILPFEPPTDWSGDTLTESVPELMLLMLGQDPASLVVLGPTSTAGHGADGPDLGALVADLDVQWAINGRYIEAGNLLPGDGRGVLVELIRASDGAHVWVEAHPLAADPDAVARSAAAAVASRLGR